ncbi:MAG: lamin tail domain-containing protein, partial [Verrucomicrobiota bacterium]
GRTITRITGDGSGVDPSFFGRAIVELDATLPIDLTDGDQIVIQSAMNPTNNGTYTIAKVLYSGTENTTRTREILLTEPLTDEDPSPAVADFLYDGDRYEFVEVKNTGGTSLNLSGVRFIKGIDVQFPDGYTLAPGAFAVVARHPWDFNRRYPGVPLAGSFPASSLSNGGEELELAFGTGERFDVSSLSTGPVYNVISHVALPITVTTNSRVRLFQTWYPLNNGLYRVRDTAGNDVMISPELKPQAAGAKTEFFDIITGVDYNDRAPWTLSPDGYGFSLVPTNANPAADQDSSERWRASSSVHGSPGSNDPMPAISQVLVNEALTHTDQPLRDAIELANPNSTPVILDGWYLTDDLDEPQKWVIPPGNTIPGNGHLTFYEGHYVGTNLVSGSNEFGSAFSLSSLGDEVYVFSPTLGFAHGFDFEGAYNGVSFGRYVNSIGEEHFPSEVSRSLGLANPGPLVDPVVISEIMYHP